MNVSSPASHGFDMPEGWVIIGPFNSDRIVDRANMFLAVNFNSAAVMLRTTGLLQDAADTDFVIAHDLFEAVLDKKMNEEWRNLSMRDRIFWVEMCDRGQHWPELVTQSDLPTDARLREVFEEHVRDLYG